MSKPEVLTGRKDGKTRRNAVKHNKEYATVIALNSITAMLERSFVVKFAIK